jgi:hypothetical protein
MKYVIDTSVDIKLASSIPPREHGLALQKLQDVPTQSGVAELVPQPAARENELNCYLNSGYRESSCFRLRVGVCGCLRKRIHGSHSRASSYVQRIRFARLLVDESDHEKVPCSRVTSG